MNSLNRDRKVSRTERLIKQTKDHIRLANSYLNEDGGELEMVIKHLDMAKGAVEALLKPNNL